ncbi:hypothetical protein [uncultured Sphingomonas sp.]|jgi:hypothetical protein|uniref:hypothetical protein n=1 Tax=uncultured Sphingomonas sp. TaxID=158754 RepID=UPI0026030DEF|nr:hypothetical protein [uncultured Sphingomonas sp.]
MSNVADLIVPLVAFPTMFIAPAWVIVTRMKIKNGYPLGTRWGEPIYPHSSDVAEERVRLVTQENAQLRAELGAVKDRLVTIERIVTDGAYRLDREIETLRGPVN